jgi:hypothetical protein
VYIPHTGIVDTPLPFNDGSPGVLQICSLGGGGGGGGEGGMTERAVEGVMNVVEWIRFAPRMPSSGKVFVTRGGWGRKGRKGGGGGAGCGSLGETVGGGGEIEEEKEGAEEEGEVFVASSGGGIFF